MVADHWEWVERVNASGGAVIVAITPERQLVLVEQYRIPLGAAPLELPAGLAGDTPDAAGEAIVEAARRELLEETGYEASDWQMLIEGYSSAGLTNESYHLFLARNARKVGAGRGRRPRADRGGHGPAGRDRRVAPVRGAAPAWRSIRRSTWGYISSRSDQSGIPLGATAGLSSSDEPPRPSTLLDKPAVAPNFDQNTISQLQPRCGARRSPADSLAEPLAQPLQRRAAIVRVEMDLDQAHAAACRPGRPARRASNSPSVRTS